MTRQRAFTLLELMIVVVLVAIVLTLAAPSFYDFIKVQRLKGVNAQLVTDLQYARSEAVSRNTPLRLFFAYNSSLTCYSLYTTAPSAGNSVRCDCRAGAGAACAAAGSIASEVRTVQIPRSMSVTVLTPSGVDPAFAFDAVTGGIYSIPTDNFSAPLDAFVIKTSIDSTRTLTTTVGPSGRVTVCGSATNLGAPLC